MAAISVRGLDDSQLQALKQQAQRQGISLNRLALERLTGSSPDRNERHHDLDALAGTWTDQDGEAFNAAIAPLEQIDVDLWA